MRLLMSIPSLAAGGAERQFAELACGLAARGHQVLAVTLGRAGPLAEALGQARLLELDKASRLDSLRVHLALAGLLRREKPQVHYAFLPSCCVPGALLRPLIPGAKLVMGVRASGLEPGGLDHAGRALLWLEARLSSRADLVIANSRAGRRHCLERGFPGRRTVVVENGIDTLRLRPDKSLGAPLRHEWGVGPGELLIGLVARLNPMKDHPTFLAAAARLAALRPELRFVCVGAGPEAYARGLRDQALGLGLGGRLLWAGQRHDMPRVYNALDLLCLSSAYGEGFPNVLGEAMSCGIPCVSTDVGDAARVLGATGIVVPPGKVSGLVLGLEDMLERLKLQGRVLGDSCREHVCTRFSVGRMVAATEDVLCRV